MTEIYFKEVFDILSKYKDNNIIYSEDIFNKINKIYSKLVKRKNVSQLNLTDKIYLCLLVLIDLKVAITSLQTRMIVCAGNKGNLSRSL